MPVSYTHLDVYKRQVICSITFAETPINKGIKTCVSLHDALPICGKLHVLKNENSSTDKRKTIMALIVYNRENSRPQEVTYKGKRTINLDSRGTVYLSKTMSIELGILGGGRVNFAHDDETGDWYICRADDSEGFIVWKDKRCARFSAGFIVQRLMRQAKVERKSVQFMMARMPVEIGGVAYYKILLSNPILR